MNKTESQYEVSLLVENINSFMVSSIMNASVALLKPAFKVGMHFHRANGKCQKLQTPRKWQEKNGGN